MRHPLIAITLAAALVLGLDGRASTAFGSDQTKPKSFTVHPIGYVRKSDGKTTIVLDKKYQPGLLGIEKKREIWVIWWFDRNDTPEDRAILQVHPRADRKNPLTGVFATRSPVRPNLIALSRCKIISVKDNVIEIDEIDAFPGTPVLDIKRVIGDGE